MTKVVGWYVMREEEGKEQLLQAVAGVDGGRRRVRG